MARLRPNERALKLYLDTTKSSQYICRACRAQQIRRLHASTPAYVGDNRPWSQRIRDAVFGKKTDEAEQLREEKAVARTKEMAKQYSRENPYTQRQAKDEGRVYNVAAVVDPDVTLDYVAAETWENLPSVGSKQWAKQVKDGGEAYEGYAALKRHPLNNEQLRSLLHNISVETILLQKAGHDVNQLWQSRKDRQTTFKQTPPFRIAVTANVAELTPPKAKAGEQLLQRIFGERGEEREEPFDPESVEREEPKDRTAKVFRPRHLPTLSAETGSAWMSMRLSDDKTKLAIAKRIAQVTGRRVPDPVLSNATTIEDFYNGLRLKEGPHKLAQNKEFQDLAASIPNVKIRPSRQTIVHKEKEVGRWKVIAAELTARGLPVLGNNHPQGKSLVEPKPSRLDRKMRRLKKA